LLTSEKTLNLYQKNVTMSLIKKLFSRNKKEPEKSDKVRTQYKDEKYFSKELTRINEWLDMDEEDDRKILKEGGKLLPSHYYSSYSTGIKKLEVLYALYTKPFSEVLEAFQFSLGKFIKSWDENFDVYSDILNMVSLGILLEIPDKQFQEIEQFVNKTDNNPNLKHWKPDALVGFMLNSRNTKREIPPKVYSNQYRFLNKIVKMPPEKAIEGLKEYIEEWYDDNKKAPWYNTHLREWGYSGYWSWEAAAIAKIMKLDDESLKDKPHYPYDLLHNKEEIPHKYFANCKRVIQSLLLVN